jgi:hypothetical protein
MAPLSPFPYLQVIIFQMAYNLSPSAFGANYFIPNRAEVQIPRSKLDSLFDKEGITHIPEIVWELAGGTNTYHIII